MKFELLVSMSLCLICACGAEPDTARSHEAPAADPAPVEADPGAAANVALEPAADERGPPVEEARAKAAALASALQSHLMGAMKEGGAVAAVSACNEAAPEVAAAVSTEGWTVGRTALKLRNPGNAPDPWERSVLEDFERRLGQGEAADTLEAHVVVEEEGTKRFRYMKAILTSAKCLVCHGETLEPGLAAAIDGLYPQDEARGFSAGQLRGAFTLSTQM